MPKHPRVCNTLSWNPLEHTNLAAGLEKHRSDFSIIMWDVGQLSSFVSKPVEALKPVFEQGLSEVTHSLAWFLSQPKVLVAGMNNKHLKIYDLRGK